MVSALRSMTYVGFSWPMRQSKSFHPPHLVEDLGHARHGSDGHGRSYALAVAHPWPTGLVLKLGDGLF